MEVEVVRKRNGRRNKTNTMVACIGAKFKDRT
jgi:hypothetical protein